MGETSHVGGCPMFSPRGEPQFGARLGERTSWFTLQHVSLLLQGDALRCEPLTAMLVVTSKYRDVAMGITVFSS